MKISERKMFKCFVRLKANCDHSLHTFQKMLKSGALQILAQYIHMNDRIDLVSSPKTIQKKKLPKHIISNDERLKTIKFI